MALYGRWLNYSLTALNDKTDALQRITDLCFLFRFPGDTLDLVFVHEEADQPKLAMQHI